MRQGTLNCCPQLGGAIFHLRFEFMKFEKISNMTLRQKVYDQLRMKIISAEILPGELLTVRDLANKLGVSSIPVREALWQLESEKVIVIENNKSIHVNKLTAKEMEEALRIRLQLESLAVERACDLRAENAIPKVKQLLDTMYTYVDNSEKYMHINTEFHFTIYSYADSPLLLQIIDMIWARIGPYFFILSQKGADLSSAMKCHQKMFEAFAEKNKEKMREFLQKDLNEAARFIIPYLEQ
jgi:DNA-binding GntR family transcriptional regulator